MRYGFVLPGGPAAEQLEQTVLADQAGCTWWVESRWALPHHSPERMRETRERLEAGPPRR